MNDLPTSDERHPQPGSRAANPRALDTCPVPGGCIKCWSLKVDAENVTLTHSEMDTLARYNAEVWRGILHTEQWKARMAGLQARFDAKAIPPHWSDPIDAALRKAQDV